MRDGILDDLMTYDEESYQKILLSLMANDENISMKTEIQRPLNLTRLVTFAFWLNMEGEPDAAQAVELFVNKYQVFMVSNQRKSREEIIRALTEAVKEDRTAMEKLASKEAEK